MRNVFYLRHAVQVREQSASIYRSVVSRETVDRGLGPLKWFVVSSCLN